MAFSSVEGLLAAARTTPLWQAVLEDDQRDRGVAREHSWAQMERLWKAMQAPLEDYDPARRSPSGLSGGEGARLDGTGPGLCPPFLRRIIAAALKTGECNACMRRIVAAPTAGASGVLPAVLIPLRERDALSDEVMIQALYVAAGFGQVIATRASIAGAEGGCQAEVGSASGMAAAALVQMLGGTPEQALDASSIALSNLLGLVCDPVGGLVEVPCQNRNAIGVAAAFSSAQLALAGIKSLVPFDQMAHVMLSVGHALPATLRETAKGGIAQAPAALSACAKCGVCG